MTPKEIAAAADALDQAEQTRQQIGLLSLQYTDIGMRDAYAIQAAWIALKRARGRVVKGWKIGLTSKAMQYALNIDIPDSGILLDDMFFANDAIIPKDRFIQPRVEAEIAFVMKADLAGPNCNLEDVLNATDYIVPAIEILDTRIVRIDPLTNKTRTVFDTISDNAANAGIVLGNEKHQLGQFDLRWVGAIVSRNGVVEETGLGAGVLNNPALGIVWLTNRLAQNGDSIRKGDVVLSGSFIRPVEATSGSVITADFGEFGIVSCHFE